MRGRINLQGFRASQNKLQQASMHVAALLFASAPALAQQNQAPDSPRSSLAVPQHAQRVVVSIPDRKLALLEDGQVVKIYRIAVGAPGSPSPSGHFTIAHRIANPTYYAPGVALPPSPENPLGSRWIGLDIPHFGIHGTNQPGSIGRNASQGCVRMRNRDAEDLFERVRVGDTVEWIAERTEETARLFGGEAPAVLSAQVRPAAPQAADTATASSGQE